MILVPMIIFEAMAGAAAAAAVVGNDNDNINSSSSSSSSSKTTDRRRVHNPFRMMSQRWMDMLGELDDIGSVCLSVHQICV